MTSRRLRQKVKAANRAKKMEITLERAIFQSRWFLLPFYFGLFIGLLAFSGHFLLQVFYMTIDIWSSTGQEALVMILSLVDKVMVAALVIVVMIGGYESSVSRLDISDEERRLSWLGKLDASSLKLKLSTAIVSISSIHVLNVFLNMSSQEEIDTTEVMWTLIVHFVMVLTALVLTFVDRPQSTH